MVAFKPLTPRSSARWCRSSSCSWKPSWPTATSPSNCPTTAADWLAKNGFDELYGARPLARVIQEHIKKPLADDILFGRLVRGGHVKVVLKDSKIDFEIDSSTAPKAGKTDEAEPALAE